MKYALNRAPMVMWLVLFVVLMFLGMSYCQMLCMALGGDPFFNNTIYEFNASDYFSKPFRVM